MRMMTRYLVAALFLILTAQSAQAHFGMVIPSDTMVSNEEPRQIELAISFSHPFEALGMEMEKPAAFVLVHRGKTQDLLSTLTETKVLGEKAWQTSYQLKRPGAHLFAMSPQAYFEPAEDCFIIHYTKTVVAAFGDDTGWDTEVGLETEIVPLTRPFGLYGGNLFQGQVKKNGQPVPHAEVEIEYYNPETKAKAPNELMITQTIRADQNGVFSYSTPVPGWWGFSALTTSDKKMVHGGEKKDIELGAVIWVKFETWQEK